MTEDRDARIFAPGCFGSAWAYELDAPECLTCPFKVQCGPEATARLKRIRDNLGITPLIEKRAKAKTEKKQKAPPAPKPAVAKPIVAPPVRTATELPKKVQALLGTLSSRGIDLAAELRAGKSVDSPAFLRVSCDLLLQSGFDRDQLRTAFVQTLGWGDGTASSHVGQIFALMPAIGAAEEKLGRLTMKGLS